MGIPYLKQQTALGAAGVARLGKGRSGDHAHIVSGGKSQGPYGTLTRPGSVAECALHSRTIGVEKAAVSAAPSRIAAATAEPAALRHFLARP